MIAEFLDGKSPAIDDCGMGTSQKILAIRKRANLSQAVLAKRIKASASAFSDWERGRNFPPLDKAKRLADCCGVTLEWLAAGHDDDDPPPPMSHLEIGARQAFEVLLRREGPQAALDLLVREIKPEDYPALSQAPHLGDTEALKHQAIRDHERTNRPGAPRRISKSSPGRGASPNKIKLNNTARDKKS
jgi:transcriptional regulator with XRE-family HTH domain